MEKLQLLMFEIIGFKLQFHENVIDRYFQVLIARYGNNSEMEKQMKEFILDPEVQKEIIGDCRHEAFQEYRYLAKMQLRNDIETLKQIIEEQPSSPYAEGYKAALQYLINVPNTQNMICIAPFKVSSAEYQVFTTILDSDLDHDDEQRIAKGMDIETIRLLFQTMICFNESLQANDFNYKKAWETAQTLAELGLGIH